MLVRALLISFVVHVAVFISAAPALPWGGESGQLGQGLVATIREQVFLSGQGSATAALERPRASRGAGGELPVSAPSPAVRPREIGPFSGPTVAFAEQRQNTGREAGREDAVEEFVTMGDGEREYRLNLAREARRYKRYPSGIDGREAEGVVVVSVSRPVIAHRPETRLQQSSGDPALDRAALEMMEQAVKTASIPLDLQGKQFRIVVPVEYRLAD